RPPCLHRRPGHGPPPRSRRGPRRRRPHRLDHAQRRGSRGGGGRRPARSGSRGAGVRRLTTTRAAALAATLALAIVADAADAPLLESAAFRARAARALADGLERFLAGA